MNDEKHEKALDLTEEALEKLNDDDKKAADQLLDQARKLDPTAPAEVVKDMEEDAQNQAKPGMTVEGAGRPRVGRPVLGSGDAAKQPLCRQFRCQRPAVSPAAERLTNRRVVSARCSSIQFAIASSSPSDCFKALTAPLCPVMSASVSSDL
jgi:hypothetical protein